ncbi:site-specific integrase [Sansalvadorimonas verongulae]|uniref:site-specific integrase n=1 Tax=Sansalvadorimonas verongulae TaxID=2172824 RepID=UPI0012BB95C8|nr:site-specific integrase [Sansalvadorimonas verongulae]MTI12401.1 site-specific integrase [Sansalvadorimonas verongulae]
MDLSHIKPPKGVTFRQLVHQISIRIQFRYRGEDCRETVITKDIPDIRSASERSKFEQKIRSLLRQASEKRNRIVDEIEEETFDYAYHFPHSKKASKFGVAKESDRNEWTVGDYIDSYLKRAKSTVRPSTYSNYDKKLRTVIKPNFGDVYVTELTPGMVRDWVHLRSHTAKRKTLSNYLAPFKHALDDAVMDGVIQINPVRQINLDKIITVESRQSEFEPDPFTEDEIDTLLPCFPDQIRNIFEFAFYTGLRTNELIGLKWEKIDWVKREVLVDEAMVAGEMGMLKTGTKGVKSRTVLLLDRAYDALERQKKHTFMRGEFVFHNPLHDTHWKDDAQLRKYGWTHGIKKSGIRYRNPYQTRHTYAHMMIRDNENLWWIANQMGHKGIEMLNRHYGGWLEKAAENYAPKNRFDIGRTKSEKKTG